MEAARELLRRTYANAADPEDQTSSNASAAAVDHVGEKREGAAVAELSHELQGLGLGDQLPGDPLPDEAARAPELPEVVRDGHVEAAAEANEKEAANLAGIAIARGDAIACGFSYGMQNGQYPWKFRTGADTITDQNNGFTLAAEKLFGGNSPLQRFPSYDPRPSRLRLHEKPAAGTWAYVQDIHEGDVLQFVLERRNPVPNQHSPLWSAVVPLFDEVDRRNVIDPATRQVKHQEVQLKSYGLYRLLARWSRLSPRPPDDIGDFLRSPDVVVGVRVWRPFYAWRSPVWQALRSMHHKRTGRRNYYTWAVRRFPGDVLTLLHNGEDSETGDPDQAEQSWLLRWTDLRMGVGENQDLHGSWHVKVGVEAEALAVGGPIIHDEVGHLSSSDATLAQSTSPLIVTVTSFKPPKRILPSPDLVVEGDRLRLMLNPKAPPAADMMVKEPQSVFVDKPPERCAGYLYPSGPEKNETPSLRDQAKLKFLEGGYAGKRRGERAPGTGAAEGEPEDGFVKAVMKYMWEMAPDKIVTEDWAYRKNNRGHISGVSAQVPTVGGPQDFFFLRQPRNARDAWLSQPQDLAASESRGAASESPGWAPVLRLSNPVAAAVLRSNNGFSLRLDWTADVVECGPDEVLGLPFHVPAQFGAPGFANPNGNDRSLLFDTVAETDDSTGGSVFRLRSHSALPIFRPTERTTEDTCLGKYLNDHGLGSPGMGAERQPLVWVQPLTKEATHFHLSNMDWRRMDAPMPLLELVPEAADESLGGEANIAGGDEGHHHHVEHIYNSTEAGLADRVRRHLLSFPKPQGTVAYQLLVVRNVAPPSLSVKHHGTATTGSKDGANHEKEFVYRNEQKETESPEGALLTDDQVAQRQLVSGSDSVGGPHENPVDEEKIFTRRPDGLLQTVSDDPGKRKLYAMYWRENTNGPSRSVKLSPFLPGRSAAKMFKLPTPMISSTGGSGAGGVVAGSAASSGAGAKATAPGQLERSFLRPAVEAGGAGKPDAAAASATSKSIQLTRDRDPVNVHVATGGGGTGGTTASPSSEPPACWIADEKLRKDFEVFTWDPAVDDVAGGNAKLRLGLGFDEKDFVFAADVEKDGSPRQLLRDNPRLQDNIFLGRIVLLNVQENTWAARQNLQSGDSVHLLDPKQGCKLKIDMELHQKYAKVPSADLQPLMVVATYAMAKRLLTFSGRADQDSRGARPVFSSLPPLPLFPIQILRRKSYLPTNVLPLLYPSRSLLESGASAAPTAVEQADLQKHLGGGTKKAKDKASAGAQPAVVRLALQWHRLLLPVSHRPWTVTFDAKTAPALAPLLMHGSAQHLPGGYLGQTLTFEDKVTASAPSFSHGFLTLRDIDPSRETQCYKRSTDFLQYLQKARGEAMDEQYTNRGKAKSLFDWGSARAMFEVLWQPIPGPGLVVLQSHELIREVLWSQTRAERKSTDPFAKIHLLAYRAHDLPLPGQNGSKRCDGPFLPEALREYYLESAFPPFPSQPHPPEFQFSQRDRSNSYWYVPPPKGKAKDAPPKLDKNSFEWRGVPLFSCPEASPVDSQEFLWKTKIGKKEIYAGAEHLLLPSAVRLPNESAKCFNPFASGAESSFPRDTTLAPHLPFASFDAVELMDPIAPVQLANTEADAVEVEGYDSELHRFHIEKIHDEMLRAYGKHPAVERQHSGGGPLAAVEPMPNLPPQTGTDVEKLAKQLLDVCDAQQNTLIDKLQRQHKNDATPLVSPPDEKQLLLTELRLVADWRLRLLWAYAYSLGGSGKFGIFKSGIPGTVDRECEPFRHDGTAGGGFTSGVFFRCKKGSGKLQGIAQRRYADTLFQGAFHDHYSNLSPKNKKWKWFADWLGIKHDLTASKKEQQQHAKTGAVAGGPGASELGAGSENELGHHFIQYVLRNRQDSIDRDRAHGKPPGGTISVAFLLEFFHQYVTVNKVRMEYVSERCRAANDDAILEHYGGSIDSFSDKVRSDARELLDYFRMLFFLPKDKPCGGAAGQGGSEKTAGAAEACHGPETRGGAGDECRQYSQPYDPETRGLSNVGIGVAEVFGMFRELAAKVAQTRLSFVAEQRQPGARGNKPEDPPSDHGEACVNAFGGLFDRKDVVLQLLDPLFLERQIADKQNSTPLWSFLANREEHTLDAESAREDRQRTVGTAHFNFMAGGSSSGGPGEGDSMNNFLQNYEQNRFVRVLDQDEVKKPAFEKEAFDVVEKVQTIERPNFAVGIAARGVFVGANAGHGERESAFWQDGMLTPQSSY
eukprot:g20429.t1